MPFVERTSDLFWDIDMQLRVVAGDVQIITGASAVAQSLKNMLVLKKLWVPNQPGVYDILFEEMNNPLQNFINLEELGEFLLRGEPRCATVRVTVDRDRSNSKLTLNVYFSLKTFPGNEYAFPVFLRRR
jgi:hypothetical protein